MSTVVTTDPKVSFVGPGAWFDAMDVDRTGDLDLDEVLGALVRDSGSI